MIIGLLSTFREGELVQAAIRSALAACDQVLLVEGPVEGFEVSGPETGYRVFSRENRFHAVDGFIYVSDAAKRTSIVRDAQRRWPRARWALWLDGDEVLMHPEHLRHWLNRVDDDQHGLNIRLVELDGSVAKNSGKVLRLDRISEYLHSSYQVLFSTSSVPVALPNVLEYLPPWTPADDPRWERVPHATWEGPGGAKQCLQVGDGRPPVSGEPHIVHLSALRDPSRRVRRLSAVESEWFERDPLVRAVEEALR